MLTSIVGINWGDEGKGRMVDLLSEDYDIVCRYQGGNNAGHTVIEHGLKVILNLLPSGILRSDTVNVLGPGMVIDIKHLAKEIAGLREKGVEVSPKNLVISDKAVITMPYNVEQDGLEEARLADKKFGSTKRGIAYIYADKFMKKAFRMGDILHLDELDDRINMIVEWKNLTIVNGYGSKAYTNEQIKEYLTEYGLPLKDYIKDTTKYLGDAIKAGKSVMFEAQLGALRDIDFGIYPYTSSSTTLANYAPIGAGIPFKKLDNVVGIMKAYSSCVGEGPFVCELFGQEGHDLREAGGEYGAATGRPRRVGGFDIPASKYGILVQGADDIALTKLDVLDYLDKIPVCVAYELDGKRYDEFPDMSVLTKAKPVYEYMDGWKEDISNCRKFEDLPSNCQKYVKYIEKATECHIKYISVGADRDSIIYVD